jgi:hypothetical protein
MEEINKINQLHPCQYCQKICKGKQCKDCHFKMIEKKQNICIDCNNTFFALRKDGTKRKRCTDCQEEYNKKYISVCPVCKEDYHAFLDDGRIFDKCYNCYKNTLTNECQLCKYKTLDGQLFCKKCYIEQKNNNIRLLSFNDDEISIKDNIYFTNTFKPYKRTCRNKDCDNISTFTYCKDCYIKYKERLDILKIDKKNEDEKEDDY